jgi:hypothetical protein
MSCTGLKGLKTFDHLHALCFVVPNAIYAALSWQEKFPEVAAVIKGLKHMLLS